MGLVIALTLLSWVPAGAYMLLNPADDGRTATSITLGGPWLMALRFNPLSWLPIWRVSHWGECLACGSIAARSSQGEGQDSGRGPATPWR